jgi:hypothetical protein
MSVRGKIFGLVLAVLIGSSVALAVEVPKALRYEVDPSWPKLPLPNNWVIGEIGGLFVDAEGLIWIINRPRTLNMRELSAARTPPASRCCIAAPPVIAFDRAGNVVHAWGGPADGYDWPSVEHGITVDHRGHVWLGGSSTRVTPEGLKPDGMVLKFTREGKFLMQIGRTGGTRDSRDPSRLFGAAAIAVDPKTNEAFIADGYGNHRVIVFDADTGAYKRMWGAYGKIPTDDEAPRYSADNPPAQQFRNVHCIAVSRESLVYVCDRDNNRMQVFTADGKFIAEHRIGIETLPPGTVGDISFWPDAAQTLMAVTDIGNFQIRILRRSDAVEVYRFGEYGPWAGQLKQVHQAAFDAAGNIYAAESAGKRVQKFRLVKTD